jgi:hypothetical protein
MCCHSQISFQGKSFSQASSLKALTSLRKGGGVTVDEIKHIVNSRHTRPSAGRVRNEYRHLR